MNMTLFITFVTSHINPYTVEDIETLLIAQEKHFEKHISNEQHLLQANITFSP